jgi:hypothetical protein
MAATFKQGDAVRLVQPVIQGTIVRREIIEDEDSYLVSWTDSAGDVHERIFSEAQLEVA